MAFTPAHHKLLLPDPCPVPEGEIILHDVTLLLHIADRVCCPSMLCPELDS